MPDSSPHRVVRAWLQRRVEVPIWCVLIWCVVALLIALPRVLEGP